jgi:hypothetical protein
MQQHNLGGLSPAGGTDFAENPVDHSSQLMESLEILEPIAASKAPNRAAFLWEKRKSRMSADYVAEFLELAVDGVLAQRWVKSAGV